MDEVYVFDRPLSPIDIADLYHDGLNTSTAPDDLHYFLHAMKNARLAWPGRGAAHLGNVRSSPAASSLTCDNPGLAPGDFALSVNDLQRAPTTSRSSAVI
jgi:hypothetical protein